MPRNHDITNHVKFFALHHHRITHQSLKGLVGMQYLLLAMPPKSMVALLEKANEFKTILRR